MQMWTPEKPIEGVRIRLLSLTVKDGVAIAELMTPDVSRWLVSWPANPTVDEVTARIGRAMAAILDKRELHFCVEERERHSIAGYVSVVRSSAEPGVGHISYWLGTAFQGKGYMTEAVRLAIATAFEWLSVDRIEAGAQAENVSSFAVMKRVGMTFVGEREVWTDIRQRNERCLFYSLNRTNEK